MKYINRKDEDGNIETVDQFESAKEARTNLGEYQMSDPTGHYYISPRATKAWYEDGGGKGEGEATTEEVYERWVFEVYNEKEGTTDTIPLGKTTKFDLKRLTKRYFKGRIDVPFTLGFDKKAGIGDYTVTIRDLGRPEGVVWESMTAWVFIDD